MTKKIEQLRSVTASLLDVSRPIHSLRPEVIELTAILVNSQTVRPTLHQDISGGETRTSNGLALSPAMAAMCIEDFTRTIAFIRGTHAAIVDIRNQFTDRPARVLYVGCGPFATLAVPLMSIFSSSEATFTLLDVHSESIVSAKSIVDTLCLSESVVGFETLDAGSYRVCPDQPPDVILIEIMQACLESEPQVSITRHLLSQASSAILIPEEVCVNLTFVDPSKEFNFDGLGVNGGDIKQDRIPVGSVFVLNRETVCSWQGNSSCRLPGSSVRVPDSVKQRYQPMLFTGIRVYQKHILKDYDSGLTYPRALSTGGAVEEQLRLVIPFDFITNLGGIHD